MESLPVSLLHSFFVFAESRSVAEAAAKLGLTQPALSKQLGALERAVGQNLFTQRGRRKTLTPLGDSLRVSLAPRFTGLQALAAQTLVFGGRAETAKVRIAARGGILERLAPRMRFSGELVFRDLPGNKVVDSLLSFHAEIGIGHKVPDSPELIARFLFAESFRLVVPRTLSAKRPALGISLLRHLSLHPLLGFREKDELVAALFSFHGLDTRNLRCFRAADDYRTLGDLAVAGLGWAVLPSYIAVNESAVWSLELPPKAIPARKFFLMYRRENRTVPWFKQLLAEIEGCFR